jgi:glycosyltransferase involved in cell wall biosynthesis
MILTWSAITPALDELANLRRLADSLVAQTIPPTQWVIVDNGSTDGTVELARQLGERHPWIQPLSAPGSGTAAPGAPIVRAFHAGLTVLEPHPDVVVKLDADVSFGPDYFERLLGAFAADPRLGIASGSCWEEIDGLWQETQVTGDHVRGASRAYRWDCLQSVLPLEEGMGWDGIDALKAKARGWNARIVADARFDHHRAVGARDGARHSRWVAQGRGAHYMGYRPTYLVLRALHQARREPAALAMIWGYLDSFVRRRPRLGDEEARALLRHEQRLGNLRARARSTSGS